MLLAAADGLAGLAATLGGVLHIDDRRIDDDELLAGLFLGKLDGLLHHLLLLQRAHDGVHAVIQEGLEHGIGLLALGELALDLMILGGAAVAPAKHPVGADDHTGQGHARNLRAGEENIAHEMASLLC